MSQPTFRTFASIVFEGQVSDLTLETDLVMIPKNFIRQTSSDMPTFMISAVFPGHFHLGGRTYLISISAMS